MTKTIWWGYVCSGLMLLGFVGPTLLSAADTFAVLSGLVLLVLYGVWSWNLWIVKLVRNLT